MLDNIYPIGSVFITTNTTNPSTYFGGTWEPIKDRFLLLAGDTYKGGQTGGEASHKLTINEMPSHTHTGSTNSTGAHRHDLYYRTIYAGGDDYNAVCRPGVGTAINNYMDSAGAHKHTFTTANTGSGNAHNNMPPYLVIYGWKKVSN